MLALLRSGASLMAVNVCTRSDYAPYLEPEASDRTEQVTTARATEDQCFAETLSVLTGVPDPIRWIDLNWSDAPLRLGIATENVLQPSNGLPAYVSELVDAFRALPDTDVVLVPLGLGDHIDHRLVREAALQTFGDMLVFYEDLPYACRMTPEERPAVFALQAQLDLRQWSPPFACMAGTKQLLAMHYPSQIAPDVAEEMDTYAANLGGTECFYGRESSLTRLELALRAGVHD